MGSRRRYLIVCLPADSAASGLNCHWFRPSDVPSACKLFGRHSKWLSSSMNMCCRSRSRPIPSKTSSFVKLGTHYTSINFTSSSYRFERYFSIGSVRFFHGFELYTVIRFPCVETVRRFKTLSYGGDRFHSLCMRVHACTQFSSMKSSSGSRGVRSDHIT